MSNRFPRRAIERLQDVMYGATDDEISSLLTGLHADLRSESVSERRPSPAPARCDRATALASVLRAEAGGDPDVAALRKFPVEMRRSLLVQILKEASQAVKAAQADKLGVLERGPTLILPGALVESGAEVVRLQVSQLTGADPLLYKLVEWAVPVAERISGTYRIREDMALVFLFLDEGFFPKDHVETRTEVRTDYPGLTRIQLDIDPHTTVDEVAAAYVAAQSAAGFGNRRTQRDKTYGLATLCADLIDFCDWKTIMLLWNTRCWEKGWSDWVYRWETDEQLRKAAYRFRRDAKHAIDSLMER